MEGAKCPNALAIATVLVSIHCIDSICVGLVSDYTDHLFAQLFDLFSRPKVEHANGTASLALSAFVMEEGVLAEHGGRTCTGMMVTLTRTLKTLILMRTPSFLSIRKLIV